MENILNIVQDAKVNKKMGNFFFNRLFIPQKIINKSFILVKTIGNISEVFKKHPGQKEIKNYDIIKAVIYETHDRLEEIKEYLKTSKNLFKKTLIAWSQLPFSRCKTNNINQTFDRYMFYADCHLKYSKSLTNYSDILNHDFECINWIVQMFLTSFLNPKYSNTEFLSIEIGNFVENKIDLKNITTCVEILKNFDIQYMNQIIEIVSDDLAGLLIDLSRTLGNTYVFVNTLLHKKKIIELSGFKQYVLDRMNNLLYKQFATDDEKAIVINAGPNAATMYKKVILERIWDQHKKRIENEII